MGRSSVPSKCPAHQCPAQSAPPVTGGGGAGDDTNTAGLEGDRRGAGRAGNSSPYAPARFVSGLDEAFENRRLDARRGKTALGQCTAIAGQALLALDAALERWRPVITTLGGPAPAWSGGSAIVGAATRRRCRTPCTLRGGGPHTAANRRRRTDPAPATPPARDTRHAHRGRLARSRGHRQALVDNRHHLDTNTNDCQEGIYSTRPIVAHFQMSGTCASAASPSRPCGPSAGRPAPVDGGGELPEILVVRRVQRLLAQEPPEPLDQVQVG